MTTQAGFQILEFRRRLEAPAFRLVDSFARQSQGLSDDSPRPAPIGTVRFQIVEEFLEGQWQSLSTPLRMEIVRTQSELYVFQGKVYRQSQSGNSVRLRPGQFRAQITSDYYQTVTTDGFEFPAADGGDPIIDIVLKPNHSYPFPSGDSPRGGDRPSLLRGALHEAGGQAISGAIVATEIPIPDSPDRLPPQADNFSIQYVTDHSGQWVIVLSDEVFPDSDLSDSPDERVPARKPIDVMLEVTFPGETSVPVVRRNVMPWKDNLVGETSFRGRVQTTNGAGIRDAAITVLNFSGQANTDANGHWRYYLPFGPPIGVPLQITATVTGKPPQIKPAQPIVGETTLVEAFVFN